jgi:hypothetical protein
MDPQQLGVSHVVHQQEVKKRVATGFATMPGIFLCIGNLMTGLR